MRNVVDQYRDELSKKKYDSLPNKVMNAMVIEYNQTKCPLLLQTIVQANMRLVYKAMTHECDTISPDVVMEYISAANESLVKSANEYVFDSIDFSYYAYVAARNHLIYYKRNDGTLIRSKTQKGTRMHAQMKYEDDTFKIEMEDEPYQEIDSTKLLNMLDQTNLTAIEKEILIDFYGLKTGEKKTLKQIGINLNLTTERIRQKKEFAMMKIRSNRNLLKKLSDLLE